MPEGIIFQSQKAHTRLRQMLVEDSLVAVVSLPAGVFKPYSGVKTSILILDRALARRIDHIAFFKVQNDGFDLGDQRRPIDQERPAAGPGGADRLSAPRARTGESLDGFELVLGTVVEKERIAADGATTSAVSGIGQTNLRLHNGQPEHWGRFARYINQKRFPGKIY